MRPTATIETSVAAGPEPGTASSAENAPRRIVSVRYVLCLVILFSTAAGAHFLAKSLEAYLRKERIELKKPLYALDRSKLAPEFELHPIQSPPLSEDLLQELGTREYVDWRLVNSARSAADPLRVVRLFITYFTGQPDMVPHVPDECWVAGGLVMAELPSTIEVTVPGAGTSDDKVPLRVIPFEAAAGSGTSAFAAERASGPTALYFFHTNGRYATTRNEVRNYTQNMTDRYAYYAKVEMSFSDESGTRFASRDDCVKAGEALLRKLLPILLSDHFVDWQKLKSTQAQSATQS